MTLNNPWMKGSILYVFSGPVSQYDLMMYSDRLLTVATFYISDFHFCCINLSWIYHSFHYSLKTQTWKNHPPKYPDLKMKKPISCLLSFVLCVSLILQQCSMASAAICAGQTICGEECVYFGSICNCKGPCTDQEIEALMQYGYNRTMAYKLMTRVIL